MIFQQTSPVCVLLDLYLSVLFSLGVILHGIVFLILVFTCSLFICRNALDFCVELVS